MVMIVRILGSILLFLTLMVGNAFALYTGVEDLEILMEEESKYLESKLAVDLNMDSRDNGTTKTNNEKIKADVGADIKVEKTMTGYWANGDFLIEKTKSDNGTAKSDYTKMEIRSYGEGASTFYDISYADVGYKKYFSEQSPNYFYGQGKLNWTNEDGTNPEPDPYAAYLPTPNNKGDIEAQVGAGVGFGKIVDLGSYERVIIVQNELMAAGLLNQKFSRSHITELLPLFRRSMDKNKRLMMLQKILVDKGLINAKDMTLDIAGDMLDAIDEAFDKRAFGLEVRVGFLQDLEHRDPNKDKEGTLVGYVKYEKPLSDTLQFTTVDYLYMLVISEASDKYTYISSDNYYTSVLSRDLTGKAGIHITISSFIDTNTSEKLYGELVYEISDVISWDNNLYYKMDQYGSAYQDDSSEYKLTSKMKYTIW